MAMRQHQRRCVAVLLEIPLWIISVNENDSSSRHTTTDPLLPAQNGYYYTVWSDEMQGHTLTSPYVCVIICVCVSFSWRRCR